MKRIVMLLFFAVLVTSLPAEDLSKLMFPSLTLLTNDILRGWTGVEEPPENVPDDTRYYITAKTIRLLTAQFRAALWYKDNFEIITSELAAYKRQYGIVVAIAKDNVAE